MPIEAFSWKKEMLKAEKKLATNIKIYERVGKGKRAMDTKAELLILKKRISEMFG